MTLKNQIPRGFSWQRATAYLVVLLAVSGCASTGTGGRPTPHDPLEPFNRVMFGFNEGLDAVVIRPVAQGYETVVPRFVRNGVSNVFGNLSDGWTALNNLLQAKPVDAATDVGRLLVNTTIGIGGFFDVASDMGLEKHEEDFGQTLGRWGVGSGPYLVLPFIGPRTVRDTVGWRLDSLGDPVTRLSDVPTRNSLYALRLTDRRAMFLPADKTIEEAAIDKYAYVRDAYLQRRRSAIFDGRPPRDLDDEACFAPVPLADFGPDPMQAVSQLTLLDVKEPVEHAVPTDSFESLQ